MTPHEKWAIQFAKSHPELINVPDPNPHCVMGATIRNPYFMHWAKPAHHFPSHSDPRQIKPQLQRAVHKQLRLHGVAHPKGKIEISSHGPRRRTNVDWIAAYQKYATGHVSIQPYTGEGTDYAIRFAQGMLEYREQHALALYHMYETFCEGFGTIYMVLTESIAALLDGLSRLHPHGNQPPSKHEIDPIVNFIIHYVDESNRQYDSYHFEKP